MTQCCMLEAGRTFESWTNFAAADRSAASAAVMSRLSGTFGRWGGEGGGPRAEGGGWRVEGGVRM